MDTWGMGDTGRLIANSYLWMVGVTTPVSGVVITAFVAIMSGTMPDLMSFVWFSGLFLVATLFLALAGAVLSVPFTYLLGRALRRVPARAVHSAAHSVLAGLLAAGAASLAAAMWLHTAVPPLSILIAVAAGAAAAIATWRQLRPAPAVVVVATGDSLDDEPERVDAQRSV
ncbi:hypothetical protein [Curtobacterium herbarum]|uniref:Uncharacterized protein n=1 Tax=Curtobacterium herbarum TaxID=150122 RepID=A0ABP4KA35_9MICO|nr:hypothetical protein [Curtobacterium herbarum]MBM7474371.1 CHASE2 domain-containing sensor protein [Curtobacterium herbarum]MCS6545757.1 hypothetical protein [Curtobacterium herbarum]